ncbi:MAG: DUF3943 domain-containing protein [Kofleriaceae bacterium]|nr:DUF3943 domain-containing protein [Kofleriaceae bacterium]
MSQFSIKFTRLNKRISNACILVLTLHSAVAFSKPEPEPEPKAEAEAEAEVASPTKSVSPEEPHYLRAAIGEALAVGAGTAWYWIDRERQVADWDALSWSQRLTLDVIRYDNNPFNINFAGHAFNGAGYHAIARANGLGLYASAGLGLLTSITWEYALEFREKVSINDLIFTTGVGVPLGEFFHVLGTYLSLDPGASRAFAAKWTAGLPMALTGALDGRPVASLATKPEMWHEMALSYSLGLSSTTRAEEGDTHNLHTVRYDAKFVRIPRYREEGTWSRSFRSAEFTEASFSLSEASGGDAAAMQVDTILLGHYRQSIVPGELSSATMLGVAMAYQYQREQIGDWDYRVGVYHFPGLAADLYLENKGLFLNAKTRLHYDFAGVNSLPNAEWNAAHPDEQGKTILRKMGYSYDYGPSARFSLEGGYKKVTLGASIWAAYYKSDEGLDRIQEDLTVDQKGSEEIWDTRLWLEASELPWRSFVRLEMNDRRRTSKLAELEIAGSLRRYTMALGIQF